MLGENFGVRAVPRRDVDFRSRHTPPLRTAISSG